jgi:cyclopropane-fatty-acyl-phospholipid synthase
MLWLRSKLPSGGDARGGRQRARLSGGVRSRRRDRAAIQYHYDVGNDFFALWLDERMIYTCAYYPSGTEDLATAQALKLEHICRKLRLQEGERLLDIGCGWGGFCIYAARAYGVRAVGVTLSPRQHGFATARVAELGLDHLVEIRLQDYRDVPETFDKIASIGMFEAVGPDFSEYFLQVHRLLKPGGLFLNHSIAANAGAEPWVKHSPARTFFQRSILGTGLIRERYIFPDGRLIPVSEANLVAEKAGLEVRDVESLREHYGRTLRDWVSRLEANRILAVRAADETVYRTWRLYMTAAALEFEKGTVNVNQTLFERTLPGGRGIPPTRADLYA